MAKNYTLAEVVAIIVQNEDAAQVQEIGKRFPLLASKVTFVAAKAPDEFADLMQYMPDNLSANKVNQSIRKALEDDVVETDGFEEAEDEDEDDAPAPTKDDKKVASKKSDEDDGNDTDYDSWNNAKMYKVLGEMGKRKDCKEKFGDLSKASMLKYLKKYGGSMKEAAEDADAEVESEEDNDTPTYESMSAIELFKLCKQRKIKVEPKKPAKYYVGLLKKADEAMEGEESDDEDWDEEEEEEAPATTGKKSGKAAGKPAPAKSAPAKGKSKPAKEDDDEDWDI